VNGIIEWKKSSLSFANGNCVQVGVWQKASFSGSNGGGCVEVSGWEKSGASYASSNCVEVREAGGSDQFPHKAGEDRLFLVRDSKLGGKSPVLAFTADEWDAFLSGVNAGEFDPAG
jgi:Domain of unknown function (DUF397)